MLCVIAALWAACSPLS